MIVAEKSRALSIQSGNDAHGAQSNAEHEPFHNTRHRPFLRIGQWPAPTTSALTGPSIAPESHNAIPRTGTGLQNDGTYIGTVHPTVLSCNTTQSETEAAGASHLRDVSSAGNSIGSKDKGLFLSRELYQFEWFRILICMLLSVVLEIIAVVLWVGSIVELWWLILGSVANVLFSSLLYVSIFVVLMEYHEAIEKFLDKHAHLWRRLQRTCLRASAYIYACGVIVVIGHLNVTFSYQ